MHAGGHKHLLPVIKEKRSRTRSKSSKRQKKIDKKEKPIVVLLFKAEELEGQNKGVEA